VILPRNSSVDRRSSESAGASRACVQVPASQLW